MTFMHRPLFHVGFPFSISFNNKRIYEPESNWTVCFGVLVLRKKFLLNVRQKPTEKSDKERMLSSRKLWLTQSKFKFIPTLMNSKRASASVFFFRNFLLSVFTIQMTFIHIPKKGIWQCLAFSASKEKHRVSDTIRELTPFFYLVHSVWKKKSRHIYLHLKSFRFKKFNENTESEKKHKTNEWILHNWFKSINRENKYDFVRNKHTLIVIIGLYAVLFSHDLCWVEVFNVCGGGKRWW